MIYDAIVVGAGIQGLWTALHLSKGTGNILLLEQFSLPHSRGSSHGQSRIIRHAYDSNKYAEMMPEAFDAWAQLEKETGAQILEKSGLLTMHKSKARLKTVIDSLQLNAEKYQIVHDVAKLFPGLEKNNLHAVFEPNAGILKADQCLKTLQNVCLSQGVTISDGTKVVNIKVNDQKIAEIAIESTGKLDIIKGKAVVLTCGPWINKVLKPLDLQLPIRPQRIEVCYWKANDLEVYTKTNGFPSVIIKNGDSESYSTPILEYPGLMKVCNHYGVPIDPDQRDLFDDIHLHQAAKMKALLVKTVKDFYPNLNPQPALTETCIYSVTPDSDFILGRHPKYPNIIIGAGFSGHGFKMSPIIGKILSELVMDKKPSYALYPFRVERFSKSNL